MTRKYIPVEEVAKEWFKDPKFVAEYDALEEEFALGFADADAGCDKIDAKFVGTKQQLGTL